jgi:4-hydroxy-4-methyl-2-oxoglutarate aldolase
VAAVNRGHHRVGPVHWVYAYDESNWPMHEQIEDAPEGSVVLVEPFDCADRAVLGDIVAKYLLLYRQVVAVVVQGPVRDAHRLIKEDWPVWSDGFTPVGCFNRAPTRPFDADLAAARRAARDGALAVCDDTGVVLIPKERQNQEFLDRLAFIEEQEDVWYQCIDQRKWSTFQTICRKDYARAEPGRSK